MMDAADSSLAAAGVTRLPFAHTARGALAAARRATGAAACKRGRRTASKHKVQQGHTATLIS